MLNPIILRGLPASGKSTEAKKIIEKHGIGVRLNKDLIREMLHFDKFTPKNEKLTIKTEQALAKMFVDMNIPVVIDDTNLNPRHIEFYKTLGDAKVMDIKTSPEECVQRDIQRAIEGKKFVGSNVIWKMARQWDRADNGKMDVIVDIDGTLANLDHRLHFVKKPKCEDCADHDCAFVDCKCDQCILWKKDWKGFFDNMDKDTIIQPILDQVMELSKEHNIVCVSGRPDSHEEETMYWLGKHGVPIQCLIMRSKFDHRPDDEVKRDILHKYFKKENVHLVIDDRPRVIRMWREEGLTVQDVGPGIDF